MFKWEMRQIFSRSNSIPLTLLFIFVIISLASQVSATEKLYAYFSNDSLNGLKISDAYETHNMGLIYSNDKHYIKLDLGIVSPDMHSYKNEYRTANRSFGELVSIEVGETLSTNKNFSFYGRIRGTRAFGLDKLQDFAHRVLSLQRVNTLNDSIRMPVDTWFGFGLRNKFGTKLMGLSDTDVNLDGFIGLDTTFITAKLTKEFRRDLLTYDFSLGGRLVAYDHVISAPPIRAEERHIIPEISFGISYDTGAYTVFVKDTFSLPSIEADRNLYGVLSMGASYKF